MFLAAKLSDTVAAHGLFGVCGDHQRDMQLPSVMQNVTFSNICKKNVSSNALATSLTLPSLLFLICIIYQDLCKPFNIILWDIIFSKLERHIFDRWPTQWVRNWLAGWTQRPVAWRPSGEQWWAVSSGVTTGTSSVSHLCWQHSPWDQGHLYQVCW